MADRINPLLDRIREELHWPDWSSWSQRLVPTQVDVALETVDHHTRNMAVGRRLDLARTIDKGGPYIEVFRAPARKRLTDEVGHELGPLATFTFAIKDLIAVAGHPMRAGSAVRADAPPEPASAPIVARLEALGAVAVGLVTLHEFAFGVTGVNVYAGTASNPAAPDRITGGSSSGSAAAVADGSARIAIGTDTGGSIRVPASFCGVVGYKPSFGLYPTDGVYPLSGTLDHVGLFATTTRDIATVHHALGFGVEPPRLPTRIGVPRAEFDRADPEVRDLAQRALDALGRAGCEIIDVEMPSAALTFAASTAIMFSEAAAVHAASVATAADRYGPDIVVRLETGAELTSVEVAAAHELARQLIRDVQATLGGVDVIVGPTTPMVAPLVVDAADPALPARIIANTRLANVIGLPAISLPLHSPGAPVGLQLMGRDDAALLAFSGAVEGVLGETPG